MGAGVIPFSVKDGKVHFLFHKTFSGRRAGLLVDFGGGCKDSETYRETAIREFIEETETLFFSETVSAVTRTEQRLRDQSQILNDLFDKTLGAHPDWWCQREPGKKVPPKNWRTFFIEVDYQDLADMNREWETDNGTRFSKRRLLLWVPADELLEIYDSAPERLWTRVRQLQGAQAMIREIKKAGGQISAPKRGNF